MDSPRTSPAALVLPLLLACAPGAGSPAETETDASSSGTSGASDPSATLSATGSTSAMTTAGSNSASATGATTTATTTAVTTDSDETTAADESTAGAEDRCPPGTDGCPCDIGSTCEGDLMCVEGTCLAEIPCDEPEGEPNDDEASAIDLGMATCGQDPTVTSGGLDGEDVDWFRYALQSAMFCFDTPSAAVTADLEVEVCMYAVCGQADPNVSCFGSGGLQMAMSPDGLPGCCGNGATGLPQAGCGFQQTPPASVEVSVTGGAADACTPYELEWSY